MLSEATIHWRSFVW